MFCSILTSMTRHKRRILFVSITYSELYRLFFQHCVKYPIACKIALETHCWEQLDSALDAKNLPSSKGVIEGSIVTYDMSMIPICITSNNIKKSYFDLRTKLFTSSVALIYLNITTNFFEQKEVVFCCDGTRD